MNIKCGGFHFVIFLIFLFARNGSPSDTPKTNQNSSSEIAKSDPEDSAVNIILPKTDIISNISANTPASTVSSKTTTSTTPPTTTTTTSTTSTTSSTTSTTTTTPSTTSTTTTTPAPITDVGKWVVKNATTKANCIITQMAMQINVTYPNIKNEIQNATIHVPAKGSTATGNCSNPESITITWGPNHSLTINFGMNSTAKDFFISSVVLEVNATIFKDVNESISKFIYNSGQLKKFATPVALSYKCSKAQSLNLTSSEPLQSLKAVLTLTDTQFEAYVNKTEAKFSTAQDCEPFETPDVVPIAVGCALAILVLVVLVAYLIGRKRSQNRGYLSM